MAENHFESTMAALFKGMDGFISSKTVVGEPISFPDGTTIVPLVDVSFGAGAGAFASDQKKKDNGVGAMNGKISPSSVLVLKDGSVRLVNLKNQDSITRVMDLIPEVTSRVQAMLGSAKGAKAGPDDQTIAKAAAKGAGKAKKAEKAEEESTDDLQEFENT